jgi:hypothetical protein
MSYVYTNQFGGFGQHKSASKAAKHPDSVLKKAKQSPDLAINAFLYPVRTIAKKAIAKVHGTPTGEDQMKALIEKVLLEHGLIAPNPNWDHPFHR